MDTVAMVILTHNIFYCKTTKGRKVITLPFHSSIQTKREHAEQTPLT